MWPQRGREVIGGDQGRAFGAGTATTQPCESDWHCLLEPVLFALCLRLYLPGRWAGGQALSGEGLNSQAAARCQPDVMAGHSGGALGRKAGGRAQRWPQLGSRSLTAPLPSPHPCLRFNICRAKVWSA
uniref:Uncharacterized protein n=1 Tax=Pipistrellus kuhlii TaxID=59472 RepID=A0A7J7YM92_PIPKU|nr:hypothetical protein mPipKuh1_010154 [Pipistrellus kuhlii]